MKKIACLIFLCTFINNVLVAQKTSLNQTAENEIATLIEYYNLSRETRDTTLLNSILTPDVDQLVSSGEWRYGREGAMKGMMQSSVNNPGKRSISVDKIRFINPECAIADARYEIENADGTSRKMWSTFIVILQERKWKIAAIRNMKPAS